MPQSDPKYQIKIIKAGIGDPLLTLQFQFTNSDGTFDLPTEENPVNNVTADIRLNWAVEGGGSQGASIGNVSVWKVQTTNVYNLTLPFDLPAGFPLSSAAEVSMDVTINGNNGYADITLVNGTGANTMATALTFFSGETHYGNLNVNYEWLGN